MFKKLSLMLVLCSLTPLSWARVAARAEPSESCSTYTGLCWPILKLGARGEKVCTLQILLKSRGLSIVPDGSFGTSTRSAVRTLQRRKHLKPDGLVGEQTWSEVVPDLKRDARGETVRQLQILINRLNKSYVAPDKISVLKVDGFYGLQTERAVRRINEAMRFDNPPPGTGSGLADEAVWCALLGGHYDGE